jgi:hypothetical protein
MNVGVLRFINCHRFTNSSCSYISFVPVEIDRTYGLKFCNTDLDSDTAFALRVWVVANLLSELSC